MPASDNETTNGTASAAGRPRVVLAGSQYTAGLVLVFILSIALYANTLKNGFVYDDTWQVVKNSWIRHVRFIPDIVTSEVWNFSGDSSSSYYRPVMYLVYMAVYVAAGLDPRMFHLLSVLLNAMVCAVVFMTTVELLRQLCPSRQQIIPAAFVSSVLFAAHPVHTEAVAWIACVPELTYSLFCLLSLYFHIRAREGKRGAYALSVAAFLVALFCKEPAILFLFVLIAYDYCLGWTRGEHLARMRRYLPYIAAAAVYLGARVLALGGLLQAGKHHQHGSISLINIFPLFSDYLAKLVWPTNLNGFTVFEPVSSLLSLRGGVGLIVAFLFIAFLAAAFKKNGLVFMGLSIVAIPLLPALYIPALPENIFAERYLYLPSFGCALLIASCLAKVSGGGVRRAAVSVVLVAVAVAFSVGVVRRNAVWKDNATFYADVVSKSPGVPMMHVNLGWTYQQMGLFDGAIKEYRVALTLKPDLADPHNNFGLIFERQNRIDEAIKEYITALDLEPDYPAAHNNLGNAYMLLNQVEDAMTEFQAALRLSPRHAAAHYNLGNAYSARGFLNEAVREYREAINLDPDDVDARNNLGVAYLNLNRRDEAIEEFKDALKIDPHYLPTQRNLDRALSGGY